MKVLAKTFLSVLIALPIISYAANEVYHKHGDRGHKHVLPQPQGVNHQHGGAAPAKPAPKKEAPKQVSKPTKKTGVAHIHGDKQHTHVLPGGNQINHRHGNSAVGQKIPETNTDSAKVAPPSKEKKLPKTRYICSEITQEQARSLFSEGHSYLDRDGDDLPCEPTDFPRYERPSGSNCHWVSGYRRKSGSYVRGHMRCR